MRQGIEARDHPRTFWPSGPPRAWIDGNAVLKSTGWFAPPALATGLRRPSLRRARPLPRTVPSQWISVPSQRARHDIRRPGQEGEFKGAEYSEFRNHAEVRRVAVRDHELLGFPHHPEIQDGTRKLALRLNSWACWLLPTSLETESNEVGEAGDLKGLRDPPQSLRVGGFFF